MKVKPKAKVMSRLFKYLISKSQGSVSIFLYMKEENAILAEAVALLILDC